MPDETRRQSEAAGPRRLESMKTLLSFEAKSFVGATRPPGRAVINIAERVKNTNTVGEDVSKGPKGLSEGDKQKLMMRRHKSVSYCQMEQDFGELPATVLATPDTPATTDAPACSGNFVSPRQSWMTMKSRAKRRPTG